MHCNGSLIGVKLFISTGCNEILTLLGIRPRLSERSSHLYYTQSAAEFQHGSSDQSVQHFEPQIYKKIISLSLLAADEHWFSYTQVTYSSDRKNINNIVGVQQCAQGYGKSFSLVNPMSIVVVYLFVYLFVVIVLTCNTLTKKQREAKIYKQDWQSWS